jgi:phosphopantothenoylcysteine decarboxylase/phosphopantothenate--cysteine ligase
MLVSLLVQSGCGVTVAMTRNARRFIGDATFAGLTGRAVLVSPWRMTDDSAIPHLHAAERADLILVAPATANIIAKLAGGVADDLVSALLLGAACPVMLAPAMNQHMWRHPAVQRNIGFLRVSGFALVGPETGWQACRTVGPGRMSEPATLAEAVRQQLQRKPPKNANRR